MEQEQRQRIDRWLFFARIVKSRSLAAKLVQSGRVRVNRDKIDQAARNVKVDDVLTITLERQVLVYRIVAPGSRRGPAPEARTLYEDLTPAPEKKEMPDKVAARDKGSGRPTKRDRRLIDKFHSAGRD